MKYYKSIETGSVYRTENTTFSDGTPTLKLQRWNWDMDNWHGHIYHHEKTRKQLAEGKVIVEITEQEVKNLTQKDF